MPRRERVRAFPGLPGRPLPVFTVDRGSSGAQIPAPRVLELAKVGR